MTSPLNPICPRCGGFIPSNERPGEYMGALSRTTCGPDDEPVEVCSACGNEEGLQDFFEGGATPQDQWPLRTATTPGYDDRVVDGQNRIQPHVVTDGVTWTKR